MKHFILAVAALALAMVPASAAPLTPTISGQYVEARTCDVWTGPCFANGEINLMGKQAVAGWIVGKGAWGGVPLDGLKVAAAITSQGTLHTAHEGKVTAVVFVDEKATPEQAKALVEMARALAPRHLETVVKVEKRAIGYVREGLDATLSIGDVAKVKCTAFCACDKICCNEEKAYPSISESARVDCAKTLENEYRGTGLDSTWSDPLKRGSMVGTFAK